MKVKQLMASVEYHPSLLAYGTIGTGKTAFFGQAGPRGHLIEWDEGFRTLATMNDRFTPLRLETDIISCFEGNPAAPTAYVKAKKHVAKLIEASRKPNGPLIAVTDSLTGLIKAATAQVTAAGGHACQPPTQREWGIIFSSVENFLCLFKSIRAIKIVCAHHRRMEDDDGSTRYELLCPGKDFPGYVLGFFDDVFHCKMWKAAGGKYKYVLSSTATSAVAARTRSGFTQDYDMDGGLWPFLRKIGYADEETIKLATTIPSETAEVVEKKA